MSRFRMLTGAALALFVIAALAATSSAEAVTADIVVSEVMYHAADGTAEDDDDYDYIELVNRGTSAVDLLGWTLADGVDFVFEESNLLDPGEYVVIAEDADAFEERYGTPPAGVWDGKLKNSSELIELHSPDSNLADMLEYDDDPPWPGAADGEGRSLERLDLNLANTGDDQDASNWLASVDDDGTPGQPNSVTTAGPVIFSVADGDQRPPSGQDIPISAKLSANADTVTLSYKVDFGDEQEIVMLDDQASVGGADDGTYSALVPAQPARSLVRYVVTASNENGENSSPSGTDTINYHGFVVADPNEPTDIPVLDYFIAEADYELLLGANRFTDNTSPIVVAYGDTVVDNATIRVRGNATRTLPKPSMRIELPKGQLISFDGLTEEPVDEFNLFWRNDLKADLGWELAEELGFPRVEFFGLRVFRNGTFWGTGAYLAALDGRWREANGYDDAAIYKGGRLMSADETPEDTSKRFEKKEGADGDFTDIWEFSNLVMDRSSDEQFRALMETLDVPAVINYWAYVSFLNQVNSDRKNFYLIRDPEGSGRWRIDPWDLNMPLGAGNLWTNGMPLIEQLNKYDVFREMHARRLRTMIDSYTVEELNQRFDDKFAVAVQSFDEDHAIWRKGFSSTKFRSTWVDKLPTRYEMFASNTGKRSRSLPVSQSDLRPIQISAITEAQEGVPAFVELTNASTVESFDLTGWTIAELDLTIDAGAVLLPGATVAFTTDDVAFREATDGRFVSGEFSELPDDGSLTLADADGNVVSMFSNNPDVDGDGVDNAADNCPADSNPDQADLDGDGVGDVCDDDPNDGPSGDLDGDGVDNAADNCPADSNPDQADLDGDGVGDVCDDDPNDGPSGDLDGDGVDNAADNCPADSNPDQADLDGDGVGDVCDETPDGSTVVVPGVEGIRPTVTVEVGPGQIAASWSTVAGASKYQFRYRLWRRPWIKDLPAVSFQRTINFTPGNAPYAIQVRAQVGGTWHPWTLATATSEGS